MAEVIRASAGFIAPTLTYGPPMTAAEFWRFMPRFMALRDFAPPEVRWARARERTMRRYTKMWQWPRAPEVSR